MRAASLFAVGGGVLFPAAAVCAEGIYRWTDSSGTPCYSNVGPPVGISGYTTTVIPSFPSGTAPASPASVPPGGRDGIRQPLPVTQNSLLQRIADRREDIRRLETLLVNHPDDPDLRKNLIRKKQYLGEELLRLKLLRPQEK